MAWALARFPAPPVVPLRPAPKAAPLDLGPPASPRRPAPLVPAHHLQGLSVPLHFQRSSVLSHHFQGPSAAPLLHGRVHQPEPRQARAERAAEESGSTHHH
jgi:hypothetical protein